MEENESGDPEYRETSGTPTSASETPIVIYLSRDILRMVKGYFARRRVPFEGSMSGNVVFAEGPSEKPQRCLPCARVEGRADDPTKRMPRNIAENSRSFDRNAALSYLPEVPSLTSCRGISRSDGRGCRSCESSSKSL